MTTLVSIHCALRHLGFAQVAQLVGSSLWSKDGVSVVAHDSGLVRVETLRDVRVVRCANQPPMMVRNLVLSIVRDLTGEKK